MFHGVKQEQLLDAQNVPNSTVDHVMQIHSYLTRDTHLMQKFIYYYKQLYVFRASICPSSGVLGCIRIILLHMAFRTMCCD